MAKTVVRMATTGPWAQRWAVRISLLLIVVAAFVGVRTVLAVHDDGFFELDRNPQDAGPALGDDWENVYLENSSASAAVFVADGEGPTIFTQGGSKDDLDTNNWVHTNGSTPDKDELLNAYAARYGNNLYFGADRTANNGDAVMGFWFFQGDVQAQPNGTFGPDQHQDGDILILSDFTKGGGTVTIRVFRWNGPGGDIPGQGAINGTLDLIAGSLTTPADCVGPPSVPAGDPFCATVNTANVDAPWPFDAKVAAPGVMEKGLFYEGGIDLSFLGLDDECFASFLAETRASTSVDSVLKDFVGGSFQPCESGLVTTPKDADGNNIPATGISIGSGRITVKDSAALTVEGISTWSGTMSFHLCGPTALDQPYQLCETGGTAVVTNQAVNQSTTQPIVATTTVSSAGKYCWRGFFDSATDGLADATDATVGECFTVLPVQPTLTTDASADPPNGTVLGNPISDIATLGLAATQPGSPIIGGAAGAAAGGTITFNLYGPNNATCTGTPVYTNTVNVSGNGNYNSGNFTPTLPGVYRWVASYSGNLPNTLSASGACNDTGEASLVTDTTSIVSTQNWRPNDSATVTSTGGSAINGTLTFQLYTGGTCGVGSGSPVANQEYVHTLTNAASPATRATNNTTLLVDAAGASSYSWKVTFAPAAGSNVTGSTKCEATSLNINNNAG